MSLPMLKLKVYELHTKMEIVCRRLGTVDAPSCIFIYTEELQTHRGIPHLNRDSIT